MALNNTTTLQPLEQMVSDTFIEVFGDPLLIGIAILVMMVGLVLFAQLPLDGAIVVLIPTSFIVFVFIPQLKIVAAIIFAVLATFGILRLVRQG